MNFVHVCCCSKSVGVVRLGLESEYWQDMEWGAISTLLVLYCILIMLSIYVFTIVNVYSCCKWVRVVSKPVTYTLLMYVVVLSQLGLLDNLGLANEYLQDMDCGVVSHLLVLYSILIITCISLSRVVHRKRLKSCISLYGL